MSNIFLNRLRYIFTAKGRHGTHSPFIYGFVEQVLRSEVKISGDKKTDMLYRILNYIRPDKVFVTASLYSNIQKHPAFNAFDTQIFHPDNKLSDHALYVFDIDALSTIMANDIARTDESKILIYNTHINKDMTEIWAQLKALDRFTYSVDCFSFGLLLNDKAFRLRQHFILK